MEIIIVIPEINQAGLFIFISHIIYSVHSETVETIFRTLDFACHISQFAYTIQKSVD